LANSWRCSNIQNHQVEPPPPPLASSPWWHGQTAATPPNPLPSSTVHITAAGARRRKSARAQGRWQRGLRLHIHLPHRGTLAQQSSSTIAQVQGRWQRGLRLHIHLPHQGTLPQQSSRTMARRAPYGRGHRWLDPAPPRPDLASQAPPAGWARWVAGGQIRLNSATSWPPDLRRVAGQAPGGPVCCLPALLS
jgi:hypothetical protein